MDKPVDTRVDRPGSAQHAEHAADQQHENHQRGVLDQPGRDRGKHRDNSGGGCGLRVGLGVAVLLDSSACSPLIFGMAW